MEDRDKKFGRLLAIANVLSKKAYEKSEYGISDKYLEKYHLNPALTLEKIHKDLIKHIDRFGEDELSLLDMFGEIMADLKIEELNNEPLNPVYLHAYYSQQHNLSSVMGVDEASKLWNLSPGYIKNLCAEGKITAKKIGKTWIIDKNQKLVNGSEE